MAHIIFITGGQRSGKSSKAQKLAEELSDNPVYLATARIWDEEFRSRVWRHQTDRGSHWENLEEEKYLSTHNVKGRVVVIDCITLWLTNFFHDHGFDADLAQDEAQREWDKLMRHDATFIVVSNEVGLGIIPDQQSVRRFVDLQGRMNQYIAQTANQVLFMVSGIPLKLK